MNNMKYIIFIENSLLGKIYFNEAHNTFYNNRNLATVYNTLDYAKVIYKKLFKYHKNLGLKISANLEN